MADSQLSVIIVFFLISSVTIGPLAMFNESGCSRMFWKDLVPVDSLEDDRRSRCIGKDASRITDIRERTDMMKSFPLFTVNQHEMTIAVVNKTIHCACPRSWTH